MSSNVFQGPHEPATGRSEQMGSTQYRVVLTGEVVPGFGRDSVIAALARFFEVPAGGLARALAEDEQPIEEHLDAREAALLRDRLESIGAGTRVDRAREHDDVGERAAIRLRLPGSREAPPAGQHEPDLAEVAAGHAQTPGSRRNRPGQPARDIHARTKAQWREEWVEDQDYQPSEQYHVQLFMGPDSAHLSEACERMMLGWRTRPRLTWAWGAVFSPFLWAIYRKMYAWSIPIFISEILIPVALLTFGSKYGVPGLFLYAGAALMVASRIFWPAVLKYLYCRHARRTILYLNRLSPTFAPDIDIATRGGTSRTSVLVGVVLVLVMSLLTWSIVDGIYAAVVKPTLRFSTPGELAAPVEEEEWPTERPVENTADQRLIAENREVMTRMQLRSLSRRIDRWLDSSAGSVNPARMTMTDIARALSLDRDKTTDAWGRFISFRSDGTVYKLTSAGADGEYGSADDVEYRSRRKH